MDGGRFPTTRWSIVLAAGGRAASRPALEVLCGAYWPPVYGFVRRQGHDPESAKDLTQAFFARLLEKDAIAQANAGRGRFRSFLLGCLKHFLANEWDRAHAQKRGGDAVPLPLDFDDAERSHNREPADSETPERIFDRRWAMTVVQRATHALRAEYESDGRGATFALLKPLLLSDAEESLRAAAARMGVTEGALKMTLLRLRRRYRKLLEAEVSDTVGEPADVRDELRFLLDALRA